MTELSTVTNNIQTKIYTIRGLQVMLDRDLADLYEIETRVLNQAVKRNAERFPEEFMFQLTNEELEIWKSQIVISNKEIMGLRKLPFVFTEQGVSMLSAVLKSTVAVSISIKIIKSFVEMRRFISNNAMIFQRLDSLEQKQSKTDEKVEAILNAIEDKSAKPKQGIFYDGQVYDAYAFVNDLLKGAKTEVTLIDNYIDDSVLTLFSKYPKLKITIYTQTISKQLGLDYQKYSSQYGNVELREFKNSHDRFMIIDSAEVYHIGASLKDLGKKWFAFSKLDIGVLNILEKLK